MANNSFERKLATHGRIGPGGIDCACCGPAPGKPRKEFFRKAKTRVRRFWKKDIDRQVRDMKDDQ